MRTLKKTLCLVLALVLMLSLFAFTASAETSYTDDAKIAASYREAVEVLTGIGVFNGKDDGSLAPDEALTRVQGCYLICKMLGVPSGAGTSSFSDVSAADAPYVAYIQALGITDGYGDNTFRPNDPLSGAAFAKWCLIALGYNAAAEGLTGDNWKSGVARLTTTTALANGISGYNYEINLTREQAAQMLLNTLKATMVEYANGVSVSTPDGVNVTVNGNSSEMKNAGTDYRASKAGVNNDEKMQFAEMYWPNLKLDDNNTTHSALTDMSVPSARTWTYRNADIYSAEAAPKETITSATKAGAVSTKLSGYYFLDTTGAKHYINNSATVAGAATANTGTYTLHVTVNGLPAGTVTGWNTSGSHSALGTAGNYTGLLVGGSQAEVLNFDATGATAAALIAAITGNGRQIDFYATNSAEPNRITDIIITQYTVQKVNSVTVSGDKTTYAFDKNGTYVKYDDANVDDTVVLNGAKLSKGDYVTSTYPAKNTAGITGVSKLYVYETETFSGTQSKWNTDNEVTIDGTVYNVATGVTKDGYSSGMLTANADFNNSNVSGTFYKDQFGYVVKSEAVANTNYAFIVGATAEQQDGLDGTDVTVTVRAVLSDGTVGTYKVATDKKTSGSNTFTYASGASSYTSKTWTPTATNPVVIIKNTTIALWSNSSESDSAAIDATQTNATPANSAKILMSDLYGYVYKYTLNNDKDTITLIPLTNGYGTATAASGTQFSGQTSAAIAKGTTSYSNTTFAVTADNNFAAPAAAPANLAAGGNTLLVPANAKIIVYNSSNNARTATVYTGVASMPAALDSGVGYFATTGNDNGGSGGSLTAEIIFISRGGGISTETPEYVYVDGASYTTALESGSTNYYYDAYKADGSKFQVRNSSALGAGGTLNSGLYTRSSSDVLSAKAIDSANGAATATSSNPYSHEATAVISGSMVQNNSGSWYYVTNNTNIVYLNGTTSWNRAGANLYLVYEVTNGALSGNIKTVYVVG